MFVMRVTRAVEGIQIIIETVIKECNYIYNKESVEVESSRQAGKRKAVTRAVLRIPRVNSEQELCNSSLWNMNVTCTQYIR
jgi:hypothetical protein